MNKIKMLLLMSMLGFGIGCRAMYPEDQKFLESDVSSIDAMQHEYETRLARLTFSINIHRIMSGDTERTDLSCLLINLVRANEDFLNRLKQEISDTAARTDQVPLH